MAKPSTRTRARQPKPKKPPTGETTPKGGRPPYVLTDDNVKQVEIFAGYGITEASIAYCLGIHPNTFREVKARDDRVSVALERGKSVAESRVSQALFTKACTGDLGAIVWWEKTRAGRTDRTVQEHTGEVKNRVVIEVVRE